MNKWLNFGGDPDQDPDTDPYHDTGKTCLGGGMHCPVCVNDSSYKYSLLTASELPAAADLR